MDRIDEWLAEYDRQHPIKSKLEKLRLHYKMWFQTTWLHKWYHGRYWGYIAPELIPFGTRPSIQIRFFVFRMRLFGHDPYLYTWDLGEHTFIFRTEYEAEAAFQRYKGKYKANWGHLNHPRVTENLLKYCVHV
jgi:hypothetical protein